MLARTLSRPFFSLASLHRHRHRQPLISFLHTHTHAQIRLSFLCGRRGRRDRQGARRRRSYHTTWTTGRTNQIRTGARGSSHDSYESKQQLGPPPLRLNTPTTNPATMIRRGSSAAAVPRMRLLVVLPLRLLLLACLVPTGTASLREVSGQSKTTDGRGRQTPLYSTHALCV